MRTSRKFCASLAEIFGQKQSDITPTMIEQTRRALADAGLIAKSRGRSFSEMSDREALYLLIAVGLPVKRDQRVEWIKSFDAITDFADQLLAAIVDPDFMAVHFYKGGAQLWVGGKRRLIGEKSDGLYSLMLNINSEIFQMALFEKESK
ncbi:hypothetical protein [Vibrio crassostreae]|uniref:hypothetical protein n=1 Tax=Vibrio crassostreae TaxID=246167 RepID=UPI00104BA53B|nr:hypothetical protein [Vibrio crassostreae]TCT95231.1 hypothetical protein EDB47_1463 [Vibrio crassostreae]